MIAKKYLAFDAVVINSVNHIAGNWERLRISEADKDRSSVLFSTWANAYFQYIDPNKRTPIIVKEIDTVYKELSSLLNNINRQLKNDRRITLTESDRQVLGINPRSQPHDPPPPDSSPD